MLEHSFEQDLDSGNQDMDRNTLNGVTAILVYISSHLQATERGMEDLIADMAATRIQSLSTNWQGGRTARGWQQSWGQPQPHSQEADMPEGIGEKVAHHMW